MARSEQARTVKRKHRRASDAGRVFGVAIAAQRGRRVKGATVPREPTRLVVRIAGSAF